MIRYCIPLCARAECGFAEGSEGHARLPHRRAVLNLDEALEQRVVPDRLAGAVAAPRLHGLGIGARAPRDPGEKFQRQRRHLVRVTPLADARGSETNLTEPRP